MGYRYSLELAFLAKSRIDFAVCTILYFHIPTVMELFDSGIGGGNMLEEDQRLRSSQYI